MHLEKLIENLKNKFSIEKFEFISELGADDKISITIDGVTYEKTYCFGEPLESIIDFINARMK